jgi:hypothetical protein
VPKGFWDFPRLVVGLSKWANPTVFLAVGPEIPLSVLSLIIFRLRHRSNESVAEFLRGCDHIGLLVDEPSGPDGLLFIDSFVDSRSVFLNGDKSQPRPAPLRLWRCRAGEGTCTLPIVMRTCE